MKTIYKYPVDVNDTVSVSMPIGSEILCVQMQNDIPCIWALVDNEKDDVLREFTWYGTGHSVKENPGKYIGTIQMMNGRLVFHLFED
jgi:hypothetical protein